MKKHRMSWEVAWHETAEGAITIVIASVAGFFGVGALAAYLLGWL